MHNISSTSHRLLVTLQKKIFFLRRRRRNEDFFKVNFSSEIRYIGVATRRKGKGGGLNIYQD